jgi:hypothetical protein
LTEEANFPKWTEEVIKAGVPIIDWEMQETAAEMSFSIKYCQEEV